MKRLISYRKILNRMILIYITNPSEQVAKKVAKKLIDKKLIACANIFPVQSIYPWKGKLQEEKEVIILAKTKKNYLESVEEEVKKIHSYEVPCILTITADANEEYSRWMGDVLD